MKKTLAIILAILMIVTTIPMAFAADIVSSGTFNRTSVNWALDSDNVLTISGEGSMGTYAGYAFSMSMKSSVKEVIIEEGVTDIYNGLFKDWSSLTSVYIADSVETIKDDAFRNCNALTRICIGSGVKEIRYGAFMTSSRKVIHYNGTEDMWRNIYKDQYYNQSPDIHYLEKISKPATCTEDGQEDLVCTKCDDTFSSKAIPATGEHTYVNGICACGAECAHEYFNQERIRPVQNADGTWSKGIVKAICTTCSCVFAEKEVERDHEGYAAFEESVAELEALLNREDLVDGPKTGYTSGLNNLKNVAYSLVYMEDEATMNRIVADVDNYIAAIEAGLADGTMKRADLSYMASLFDEVNAIIDGDANLIIPSEVGKYYGPNAYYQSQLNNKNLTQADYNRNMAEYDFENQLKALIAGLKDGTALKVDGLKFVVEVDAECLNNIVEKYSYDEMDNLYKRLTDEINAELTAITEEAEALTGSVKENEEALADLEARIKAVYEKLDKCLAGVHNGLVYEVTEEAKCGVNAIESATCVVCGDVITREVENSALTHSFTNYIYNEDATCTADGTKTATCDNGCGETDTVTAKDTMLKHADENSDDICDDCGTEIVKTCPDCGRPVHDDTLVQNFVCWIIMLVNLIKSMF